MKISRQDESNNGLASIGLKDSRWDRIRKKCTASGGNGGCYAFKTETVQRLIEKDYIGKRNKSFLQGDVDPSNLLNPALVMDMRHEMFQKIPRKLPIATVENQKSLQTCLNHNIAVEERFIDNELKKIRQQLERNRNKHKIRIEKKIIEQDTLYVDNQPLMQSLAMTSQHINDFYAAPIDALNEVDQLIEESWMNSNAEEDTDENARIEKIIAAELENPTKDESMETLKGEEKETQDIPANEDQLLEDTINFQIECRSQQMKAGGGDNSDKSDFERRTPSPLTPTDEFLKPMRDAAMKHQKEIRRVRFEDENETHMCMRPSSSCSNTSDGLNSLISDLADEALRELEMEEQELDKNVDREVEQINNTNMPIENSENDNNKLSSSLIVKGESAAQNQNGENSLLIVRQIKIPNFTQKKSNCNSDEEGEELEEDDDDNDNDNDEETASVHEQNRIIEQLFQSRAHTNPSLLRKYFVKWMHYTTISKIERDDMTNGKTNRINQINAFLDKIRKEKCRISNMSKESSQNGQSASNSKLPPKGNVVVTKKYQNKIKMQQDIIELQRLKLERQERLIMELKLKKLSDEAKEARQEIKNELKAVIRSGDEKSKAKAKCLQLIGNLRDAEDEDEFKRLQGKSLLMPTFLQKMQERALERNIRHEQARQRRMQQELEKEAQRLAAEEAKRREDEEARRLRIEALKEKRRMEKMAKVLKEREHQRMMENRRKAQEFCRIRLLRRIGMEGFKRLIERKRTLLLKSEALKRKVIKRTAFAAWRDLYLSELARRVHNADKLRALLVQRNAFHMWQAYVKEERSKYFVAVDWYDMKLSTYMFREWLEYTQRMNAIERSKTRKAIAHFEWNLKFKVLDCWQRLPQMLRLEKETEERRQRWRMKIWDLLPDYKPRHDTFV